MPENPLLNQDSQSIDNSQVEDLELKEYERAITFFADRRENYVFENRGNRHALLVLKNIFIHAKHTVHIVAGDLTNTEVANSFDYINALKKFLENGGTTLKIMLTEFKKEGIADAPLFRAIFNSAAYRRGDVDIYNLNGKKFRLNSTLSPVHFCFADGEMYRVETDIEERKAQCNFNDPSFVSFLGELFDKGASLPTTTRESLDCIFSR